VTYRKTISERQGIIERKPWNPKIINGQTRDQQSHYHSIIGEIALARNVGREVCKRVMVAKFKAECMDDPHLMALWNGVDDQTRDFPKGLASAFTDWLYAWQVENCTPKTNGQ
jgi:hypothetical protein